MGGSKGARVHNQWESYVVYAECWGDERPGFCCSWCPSQVPPKFQLILPIPEGTLWLSITPLSKTPQERKTWGLMEFQ